MTSAFMLLHSQNDAPAYAANDMVLIFLRLAFPKPWSREA